MKIEPEPSFKTITPEIAKEMLQLNIGNRPLSATNVDVLVKAIKAGGWKLNGETIKLSKAGRILDGQHRLEAVVKSGRTIKTLVVEGLDDDIFDSLGEGKPRSGADTLYIMGEKNCTRLNSCLIMIDKYITGRVEKNVTYSNSEIKGLMSKYPEARDCLHKIKVQGKSLAFPCVMDACFYLFSKKDESLADVFMAKVFRGAGLEEGDPEYALRERLVNNSLSKAKLPKAYVFALFIKAWNHARAGNKIGHLKLNERNGKLAEFPTIQ